MGGLQNMEMKKKKLENVGSRHAAICKRRNGMFKKADELSVLCDAEVGLITISNDGVIHEFASSSMQSIIARFKDGMKSIEGSNSENQEANEQMPEEVVAEKPKSKKGRLKSFKAWADRASASITNSLGTERASSLPSTSEK